MSEFGGLRKHELNQHALKNNTWAGASHHVVVCSSVDVKCVSECVRSMWECYSSRHFEEWWPWESRLLITFLALDTIKSVFRPETCLKQRSRSYFHQFFVCLCVVRPATWVTRNTQHISGASIHAFGNNKNCIYFQSRRPSRYQTLTRHSNIAIFEIAAKITHFSKKTRLQSKQKWLSNTGWKYACKRKRGWPVTAFGDGWLVSFIGKLKEGHDRGPSYSTGRATWLIVPKSS